MDKAFVTLEQVTKVYGKGEVLIKAVDGIDFSIEKGEFVIIVGPSGAGKTTVLNILGGMDQATSGCVWVDGQDVAKYSPRQLTGYRREDVGFVFQFYNLVPNLTALENVELALQISRPALRRGAAAGVHCPGIGQESETAVVRRTHRGAGLSDREGHIETIAGYVQAERHDSDCNHP